jgi:hypothetical protein
MSEPERGARRPETYARLAEEAGVTLERRTPPRWVRWVGWAICVLLVVGVVAAALEISPW